MNIFRRHPRADEQRVLTPSSAAPLLLTSSPGERLSVTRALGLADVYACVRVLTESAASLPLHVYRPTNDGRERVRSGLLADLLERPAPGVTTAGLIGTLVSHLVLHGNAFVGKHSDDSGAIVQLSALDPGSVTVSLVGGVPVYELSTASGIRRHGPADILHVRGLLSTDGILGLSPIGVVRNALALADALAVQATTFAQNAARPSGILKLQGSANADAAKTLKDIFSAGHSGPGRSGNIAVLEGDLEWVPLSVPLQDAEFVAQRGLSTAEIARIFRVPPWMIGAPSGDSLTYSNTADQAAAFVTFTLRPWLVCIEQALSGDRDLAPGDLYAAFALEGLLRGDAKTRAGIYAIALDPVSGWMTRAEVRQLEDLPAESPTPDRTPVSA